MMLQPCGRCRRHVKVQDESCPFCGHATHPPRHSAGIAAAVAAGLGTLAGCGGGETGTVVAAGGAGSGATGGAMMITAYGVSPFAGAGGAGAGAGAGAGGKTNGGAAGTGARAGAAGTGAMSGMMALYGLPPYGLPPMGGAGAGGTGGAVSGGKAATGGRAPTGGSSAGGATAGGGGYGGILIAPPYGLPPIAGNGGSPEVIGVYGPPPAGARGTPVGGTGSGAK